MYSEIKAGLRNGAPLIRGTLICGGASVLPKIIDLWITNFARPKNYGLAGDMLTFGVRKSGASRMNMMMKVYVTFPMLVPFVWKLIVFFFTLGCQGA